MCWSKLLSGRWILTVVAAVAFLYGVVTRYFTPEDAKTVILMVATFYFAKHNIGGEAK